LLAALLLLLAFAMLSQRRVSHLIKLFAWQRRGARASTAIVALVYRADAPLLFGAPHGAYQSALHPLDLHRLIDRLFVRWDVETLINIPTTMLVGISLVIFSFAAGDPDFADGDHADASTLGSRSPACSFRFS